MKLIVITEYDYEDKENFVIGVAEDKEKAWTMIKKYYGEYNVLSNHYSDEYPPCSFRNILEVPGLNDKWYRVLIEGRYYKLNEV